MSCIYCATQNIRIRTHINNRIDIEIPASSTIEYTDTHGGFHGDGTLFAKVTFSEKGATKTIKKIKKKGWDALPLDDYLHAMFYGSEIDGVTYGYHLSDEAGIPKVENGYWFFKDRHRETDKNFSERYSYNFTVAIFDLDTNILYFYELDT
ncbi:MAG: hypothetical protein FWE86_02925 [Oscillospiraceae bacterium]|nr:hypothetical protein [Oscillospiraceae bacterium]